MSTISLNPEAGQQETGMVAPGQEELLAEFQAEQEVANADPGLLAGKFKSVEDLEQSYRELEKKLGQKAPEPSPEESQPSPGYTQEQAAQTYGEEKVAALAERGVDLADVMLKADNGQDISSHYDALAEAFGVPKAVVESYVGKAAPVATPAESTGLSDADVAALKGMAGGESGFSALSNWSASNLSPEDLAIYNGAIDSGNLGAARMAIAWLQSRQASGQREPRLIGGSAPATAEVFESQGQLFEAMNKRDSRGRKMYETDSAYRKRVEQMLARSDIFS
jgi:hypothetical protein